MRARLSLSGAMWNWLVVSEMSWEGRVRIWCFCRVFVWDFCLWTYCYGVFVEEYHLVLIGVVCMAILNLEGGWLDCFAPSI